MKCVETVPQRFAALRAVWCGGFGWQGNDGSHALATLVEG